MRLEGALESYTLFNGFRISISICKLDVSVSDAGVTQKILLKTVCTSYLSHDICFLGATRKQNWAVTLIRELIKASYDKYSIE